MRRWKTISGQSGLERTGLTTMPVPGRTRRQSLEPGIEQDETALPTPRPATVASVRAAGKMAPFGRPPRRADKGDDRDE